MSKDFAALAWQVEMGADEAIAGAPVDRFARQPSERPSAAPPSSDLGRPAAPASNTRRQPPHPVPPLAAVQTAAPPVGAEAVASAHALAAAATTLDELEAAVRGFEGCGLRTTATNTVFADGVPGSRVMLVGEAPGADEDRLGRPFVGVSGQLLDRMLGWIDLDRRRNFYIANVIYWRPPGNRTPTTAEVAMCLPFIQRQIELARPEILVFLGASAANALLGQTGAISRIRGRWLSYQPRAASPPLQAMATFHPAYLLRSPGQKRESWRDLLMIKNKLTPAPK
jgi:uracil-DNA glycosylase